MSPRLVLLRSQSDERLVGLARAGNERAFTAIVERYRPELQALARRLCSDGRSEDVVQQAFLSAFVALNAGSEVRHLRGWLYQIVRNAAHRPAAPVYVPLDGAAASVTSVEDVVQDRALAMTTLSELARLPDRQRQAMIGTALDGRARAEIASSMGLSEGAVRQLVHRARTALRSAVTAVTPWPLAKWIAAARPGVPGTAELAAGAGAASSGGLAIKLGALLASGTLLTGAAIDLHPAPAHRGAAHGVASTRARPHGARARSAVVASPAPSGYVDLVSVTSPAAHVGAGQGRLVAHAGGGTRGAAAHREHHAPGRSGGRDGGRPGARNDGSGGRLGGGNSRGDGGVSSAGGGRDGSGGSSRASSGSDGQGRDGGQSGGTVNDFGSGSRTGSGSDGGGSAQMASDSQRFDSAVTGSGSSPSSGSGDQSGSGSSGTGSGATTATTGSSGSGDSAGSSSGSTVSGSGTGGGSGSGASSGSSGD